MSGRPTDRQTDRVIDRQTDRRPDKLTNKPKRSFTHLRGETITQIHTQTRTNTYADRTAMKLTKTRGIVGNDERREAPAAAESSASSRSFKSSSSTHWPSFLPSINISFLTFLPLTLELLISRRSIDSGKLANWLAQRGLLPLFDLPLRLASSVRLDLDSDNSDADGSTTNLGMAPSKVSVIF